MRDFGVDGIYWPGHCISLREGDFSKMLPYHTPTGFLVLLTIGSDWGACSDHAIATFHQYGLIR